MFSYGFVGFFGYIGFMNALAVRTFRQKTGVGLWAHVTLVIGILQLPYYLQVPQQMFALFAAAAIALRLQSDDEIHCAFTEDLGGRKTATLALPAAADDMVFESLLGDNARPASGQYSTTIYRCSSCGETGVRFFALAFWCRAGYSPPVVVR
ncbi:MAG: hypothetical protein R2706_16265 [Acidimicrobiales bacterium]